MPAKQGQTDQVLKITLPSSIVGARWGAAEVAADGVIQLEVQTKWVGDGADIEVRILDLEGNPLDTLKGKVHSNRFRAQYRPAKPNNTGGMFFEAELPAHKLKLAGPKIRVSYPVRISDLKLLDEEGNVIREIGREETIELRSKVEGPPPGMACTVTFRYQSASGMTASVHSLAAKTMDGKASATWRRAPFREESVRIQSELDRTGKRYSPPRLSFEVQCLGTTASAHVEIHSFAEFDFGMMRGKAVFLLPDGTERSGKIPGDGIVKLEKPKAGRIILKELVLE